MSEPTPGALLAAATQLMQRPMPGTRGAWPRVSAFLIRFALELALDEMWRRVEPTLATCPMRAQLLCLPQYADLEVARHARSTWSELSRACHYHTYELPPTAAELVRWRQDVVALIQTLAAAR